MYTFRKGSVKLLLSVHGTSTFLYQYTTCNSYTLVNVFTEHDRVPNWTRPTHVYSLCKRVDDSSYLKKRRSEHHEVHFFNCLQPWANLGDTRGGCKSSIYYLIRASARVVLVLDVFCLDIYLPEVPRTEAIRRCSYR